MIYLTKRHCATSDKPYVRRLLNGFAYPSPRHRSKYAGHQRLEKALPKCSVISPFYQFEEVFQSIMAPHILVLGGHGKIALLLTPLLLQRSWTVTSVIRSSSQKSDIVSAAGSYASNLSVKIQDIEAVTSQADAQAMIDETKPDYVVFSAGIPLGP